MADSKSDSSPSSLSLLAPDEESKATNSFEEFKEEEGTRAILQTDKSCHHHKETHGKRNDIDENTSIDQVKAPNVFERVKEEIEALVQTIHPKKESPVHGRRDEVIVDESKGEKPESQSENGVEIDAIMHHEEPPNHHHKETHGRSNDFDKKTLINEVKAPNMFERAKEEIEALVHTIHHKKETDSERSEGLGSKIGRGLEKICSPKETHGRSKDFDEKTPINEVKGPNIFYRTKEEIEALVNTIHHKKESDSPGKEGFGSKIGRGLEKICSPKGKSD